jgi:hypothetical protein
VADFFELPPLPPEDEEEPDELRQPEWMGPPRNVLGAAVPLRLVLARTEEVAVAVTDATAYPTGFELRLVMRSRAAGYGGPGDDPFEPGLMWGIHRRRGRGRAEPPPDFLRFGLAFADGTKATNLGGFPDPEGEPAGRVLMGGRGGGGGGSWEMEYWSWPLPPEGALAFVCEWPAKGISLTRAEVDARIVLDAAARAEVLWDDEDEGGPDLGRGVQIRIR